MSTSDSFLRFAGDVVIKDARITSLVSGTSMNIQNLVIGVNIYEDLFSSFITGSLVVNDSLDLMNSFPFVGEEFLSLKVFTPSLEDNKDIFDQVFYIYKISNRVYQAERNVVYEMHFISQEASVDLNNSISKSYSGKPSDIVKTLLGADGLGTERIGLIEETKNNTKYTSNFWSPSKNFNYLANQAVSNRDSASFVFFENRAGFNFVSLETLSAAAASQVFNYNSSSRDHDPNSKINSSYRNIERDYQRINELTVPVVVDSLDKLKSGAFGSVLISHDLVTKRYRVNKFDYLDNFDNEVHLNKYPVTNRNVSYTLTRPESVVMTKEIHYGLYDNFGDVSNNNSLQKRLYRILQIENHKVKITVPGRTDYTVGMVVELDINQAESITEVTDATKDKFLSGKYLIAAIHHAIDKERHECVMELIKDTFIGNIAKFGEV